MNHLLTVASLRLEMLVKWMKMDITSFWDVRKFRLCALYFNLCFSFNFYLRDYARDKLFNLRFNDFYFFYFFFFFFFFAFLSN